MHHYDLAVNDNVFPGLNIMASGSHQRMVNQHPDLTYERLGSFSSIISPTGLLSAILDALKKSTPLPDLTKLIFDKEGEIDPRDPDKSYFLGNQEGVRIYSPEIHSMRDFRAEVYLRMASFFIPKICVDASRLLPQSFL